MAAQQLTILEDPSFASAAPSSLVVDLPAAAAAPVGGAAEAGDLAASSSRDDKEDAAASGPAVEERSPKRSAEEAFRTSLPRGLPPPRFETTRLEGISARLGRPSKGTGAVSVSLTNDDTQQPLTVVFAVPGEDPASLLPFGLETSHPIREPPSFLGGPAGKDVEGLDMLMTLHENQVAWLEKLEERLCQMGLQSAKEWFGRALREADVQRAYNSCIKRAAADKSYPPNLRARVVLTAPPGREGYLTRITVVKRDGNGEGAGSIETGEGWDWVQPRLDEARKWKQCEIWATEEFRSLWITKTGFGLRANYKDVVILQSCRPQQHGPAYTDEACRELLGLSPR